MTRGKTPATKAIEVHEDGAEAESAGFECRLDRGEAFVFLLAGELDDENRIFARESDENDKSDLGENVVIALRNPDSKKGEKEAEWDDEYDREGEAHALILGREDEEDEDNAERVNEEGRYCPQ